MSRQEHVYVDASGAGVELVLYRLSEVIAAVKADGVVHIVEGEKCADALCELGLVATTNPGGAGRWRPEFSEDVLAGATCVVWADCDPPGRSHANQVAQSLARLGCRVHVVDLDPDRDDGYDIADRLRFLRKEDATDRQLAEHIQDIVETTQARDPVTYTSSVSPGNGASPEEGFGPGGDAPPLGALLDGVLAFLGDYVVAEGEALDEVTLWVASTHVYEAFGCTPYQNIVSATPEAGKTTLLELIRLLVHKAISADSISPAALFRAIEKWKATIVIDEADSAIASIRADSERAEALRGLLNGGYRRTGRVVRCVPPAHEPREFSTYAPKAFAGVKSFLADSTLSRCVTITMRRKRRSEKTKPYRERVVVPRGEALREQLEAWAERVDLDALGQAEPPMPDELGDRAKDIWEPLFAIAEHAGGTWPDRARRAALSLSAGVDLDSQDEAIQLLAAIKAIFDEDPAKDAVTSAELAEKLSQDPESPWIRWRDERDGTLKNSAQSHLARELKPFGIKSRDIRTQQGTRKGYRREQFQDDWERLLDPYQARQPRQPRQPSNHAESSTPGTRDTTPLVADGEKPANPAAMRDVADVAANHTNTGSEDTG